MSGKKMILGCFFVALVFGSAALLHAQTYVDADGCSHAAGNVPITLTSGDGFKTHFKIPMAYYDPRYDFSHESFIDIQALVINMKPICYTAGYVTHNGREYNKKVIGLSIDPSIPEGFIKIFKHKIEKDYPVFVGDEGDYKLYRSQAAVQKNLGKGIKDFLIPKKDFFSKPSYIECVRPGLQADNGERSVCIVSQQYSSHLWLAYTFDSKLLPEVKRIDYQVNQFMHTLIINK